MGEYLLVCVLSNRNEPALEVLLTRPFGSDLIIGPDPRIDPSNHRLLRCVLLEEGARLLGVAVDGCEAKDSQVSGGGKSISFAEIVQAGNIDRVFSADELEAMPVKSAKDRHLIGKPTRALDIPDKSTGTARYGIDAEIENMLFARPLIPPTRYGSVVKHVDDSAAKNIPGYLSF